MGNYATDSAVAKPTTDVTVDSTLTEIDTEDRYRFNKYGRWEFIPPISLKSKRIQTLFIPFTDQTGLIFGVGTWRGINTELHSSSCLIHQCRTSLTEFNTSNGASPDSRGFMALLDFAHTSLLPKIQMVFSWSDTGANSASFIGIKRETDGICEDVTNPFPSGVAVIGIGYRTTDTNIQVVHNDGVGAVNYIDTLIPRSTNVFMVEVEYHTATSVRVTLFDINMVVIYDNTLSTEIPPDGVDLAFNANIQNANTAARYRINMFDYIRLEKTRPPLSAIMDF